MCKKHGAVCTKRWEVTGTRVKLEIGERQPEQKEEELAGKTFHQSCKMKDGVVELSHPELIAYLCATGISSFLLALTFSLIMVLVIGTRLAESDVESQPSPGRTLGGNWFRTSRLLSQSPPRIDRPEWATSNSIITPELSGASSGEGGEAQPSDPDIELERMNRLQAKIEEKTEECEIALKTLEIQKFVRSLQRSELASWLK